MILMKVLGIYIVLMLALIFIKRIVARRNADKVFHLIFTYRMMRSVKQEDLRVDFTDVIPYSTFDLTDWGTINKILPKEKVAVLSDFYKDLLMKKGVN